MTTHSSIFVPSVPYNLNRTAGSHHTKRRIRTDLVLIVGSRSLVEYYWILIQLKSISKQRIAITQMSSYFDSNGGLFGVDCSCFDWCANFDISDNTNNRSRSNTTLRISNSKINPTTWHQDSTNHPVAHVSVARDTMKSSMSPCLYATLPQEAMHLVTLVCLC
jgi:hypothetical protein